MGPSGFVAILAGWVTTEMGRQPYVVYGLMRTAEAASPVPAGSVGVSLVMFVLTYTLIFGVGGFYQLRLMRPTPTWSDGIPPDDTAGSQRPLAAPKLAVEGG
jgi:cytochrome d ubiquinol oxidase subunit I